MNILHTAVCLENPIEKTFVLVGCVHMKDGAPIVSKISTSKHVQEVFSVANSLKYKVVNNTSLIGKRIIELWGKGV